MRVYIIVAGLVLSIIGREVPRLSIKEPTRRGLASYLFRTRFAIGTKLGPPAHVRE